jgi:hypothetical protein
MFPKVQNFSAGYYIISSMYVEPGNVEVPRISDRLYQYIQSEVVDGFGRVILKCNNQVFEVEPSRSCSFETLVAPDHFVRETLDIEMPPKKIMVFAAKRDIAQKLLGIEKDKRSSLFNFGDYP